MTKNEEFKNTQITDLEPYIDVFKDSKNAY